jgi:predicted SAM-dependent methyltransferase
VVRPPVLAVNTVVATRRTARTLATAPRPIKLELGGLVPREGWLVTNVSAVTKHFLDATTTWPIEDAAVSLVYSDNVIEHIPLSGTRTLIAEAYRCLQPGGVIRFVTPDLRAHVDKYLAGVAPKGDPKAKVYEEIGLTVEHPIDWVRIPIAEFGHHHGYLWDYETLATELERAGFRDITRCEHGESSHPDLAGIDQRADEGGVQLAVEATR